MKHLRRHWHHHLSWLGITALLVTLVLGPGTAVAVYRHVHGGYQPGPLPTQIRIAGAQLPPSWYLGKFVIRIHQQGASNSCVGQTAATIEEIAHKRAFIRSHQGTVPQGHAFKPFSAGYIWNQLNGGRDQGITYDAAFSLVQRQGDAHLRAFPPDGIAQKFVWPGQAARKDALPNRITSWRSIAPWDRATISGELHAGRPIAIAIPVTDSFYQLFGSYPRPPVVRSQYGTFHFWHSITGIGYSPAGVTILNSYGPQWGWHGRAVLTWGFLTQAGAAIVVSNPYFPPHKAGPPSKKQPLKSPHQRGITEQRIRHV